MNGMNEPTTITFLVMILLIYIVLVTICAKSIYDIKLQFKKLAEKRKGR